MDLTIAKKVLVEFQKKHEDYLREAANYAAWKSLPFWKRWFSEKVPVPHRDYLYENYVIVSNSYMLIELRMFFSREEKSVTLAINENNCGYKINVATGRISHYLGRVNPNISKDAKSLLESIRKELAPLYVE